MKPRLTDLTPYWKLFRPYLGWLAGGVALALATLTGSVGLLGLSGGFLTATALAGLVPAEALLFNVVIPAGAIRMFALIRVASRWSERVINHEATFRLLGQLRVNLYRRFSRLSPRQLGLWHGAEVLNRLTKDVDLLDNLYIRLLAPIGAATLLMAVVTAWAWSVSPVLAWPPALLALGALVLGPLVLYLTARNLSPRLVARNEALRRTLLDLVEGLDDLYLHRPAWEAQRAAVLGEDEARWKDQAAQQRRGSAARAFLVLMIGLAAWAVIALVAGLAPGRGPDGPWFVALVLVMLGTAEGLLSLPAAWLELPGTAHAARRLTDLGSQTPDPAFPETATASPADDGLGLEAVAFGYDPDQPVLRDLSLTLAPGTHVALVGPSGGGKTTLVRLLARLEDPTAGTITLGGVDLRDLPEADLRDRIGCAMQDPWVFTSTVADNLRLARPEAEENELWRVLDLVGLGDQVRAWPQALDTWIEEGGQSLSGGQRRRLALARTLLRRTAVTILDEPTEGLEAEAALALVEAVRRELAGRTLLWVTHRRHGLEAFDQVWSLENGGLLRRGPGPGPA